MLGVGGGFIKEIKTRFAGSPKKGLHALYDCVFCLKLFTIIVYIYDNEIKFFWSEVNLFRVLVKLC